MAKKLDQEPALDSETVSEIERELAQRKKDREEANKKAVAEWKSRKLSVDATTDPDEFEKMQQEMQLNRKIREELNRKAVAEWKASKFRYIASEGSQSIGCHISTEAQQT